MDSLAVDVQGLLVTRRSMENEIVTEPDSVELFPAGLLSWAGHRSGGVRKPFHPTSGRPVGERLDTPLLKRLRVWVNDLVGGIAGTPRSLLLVGGPGNGKTDAIETSIEFFDSSLGADGALIRAFARQFSGDRGLPPRRAVVDLTSLGIQLPDHLRTSIALVQDATEGDPAEGASAEELLLAELAGRLDLAVPTIYLCCVNRGILAHAATIAHEHPRGDEVDDMLTWITRAVTSGPAPIRCWPLEGYDHLAVWPMDVESLVDANAGEATVAHQIFRVALDEQRWVKECPAGSRCPFCWNRRTLARSEALDSLIQLLRFHELASGKRWTFRDLFSLVPYLLVGDSSELRIKGVGLAPCEWAAKQLELADSASQGSTDRAYAPYLLVSRLYHHRLFSRWPSLDTGKHRQAKVILKDDSMKAGIQAGRDFFRYLARRTNLRSSGSADIGEILDGAVSDWLDPAVASGNDEVLRKSNGDVYTTSDIEELFSLSVREGLEVAKSQLAPLERDLLDLLAKADTELVDENFSRNDSHKVRLLQCTIRQFAARLSKRSLGVRQGVCLNASMFRNYATVVEGGRDLATVRRQMARLLHGSDNSFAASLVTTFGQPVARRNREIKLLTRRVRVKEVLRDPDIGRPRDSLPYLQVAQTTVPMTFSLFKALEEVDSGLHEASLPSEIFALLSGVKSLVAGHIVRDELMLEDEARITFGATQEEVEIVDGEFLIIDREAT
jgi:hypothetical protein